MSLPVGQRRILERIEDRLAESDPRLAALFRTFDRLCCSGAMPWFERVRVRPVADRVAWAADCCRQVIRPAVRMRAMLVPTAFIAIAFALLLAVGLAGSVRPSHGPKPPARERVTKPPPVRRFGQSDHQAGDQHRLRRAAQPLMAGSRDSGAVWGVIPGCLRAGRW